MVVLEQRASVIPFATACRVLGVSRSGLYARRQRHAAAGDRTPATARRNSVQPRALSAQERDHIHQTLTSPRFRDQPPAQVYQSLLDDGVYLCSQSSMHRILRAHGQNGDRRDRRPPQRHTMPRLEATAPNTVWTWDCTKLATYGRGVYLTLYVVLDLFSRYVLAWMLSRKENAALACQLMDEAAARYRIGAGQLTVHQDRGAPMIAHRFIDQLIELGVTLSHSRPHVSNDNAFSEAQFATQKGQPDYPGRFINAAHGRQWHEDYFAWYNHHHHHSGLAGFTPEQLYTGRYHEVAKIRQAALDTRYALNPERFVAGRPTVPMPPQCVVINPMPPEERGDDTAGALVNFPTLPAVREKMKLSFN